MNAQQRVIPLEIAVDLATKTCRALSTILTPREEIMIQLVAESCSPVMIDGRAFVRVTDLKGLVANMEKAIATNDVAFLLQKRGLCADRIVDVEEFVESPEFMAQKGYVRPKVMEGLIELFGNDGYIEATLAGAIGWGKCQVKSTTYHSGGDGRRMTVGEAAESGESLLVPSLAENGKIVYASASAYKSGRKRCVQLRFSGGHKITVSYDHPFRTRDGYTEARHLTPDLHVACARRYPEPPVTLDISDEEVKLLAYFIADGCCVKATPNITTAKFLAIKEIRECVSTLGMWIGTERDRNGNGSCLTLSICGSKSFVEKWGIACLSKNKRVPAEFWSLNRRQLILFLNRVWIDGNVYARSPGKIEITLASEGLVDDLQFMLRRLGIVARKSYMPKKCKGKEFDAWRLQMADAPTILRFFEEVGDIPGNERRGRELRILAVSLLGKSNPNWDVVPVQYSDLDFPGKAKWHRPPNQYYGMDSFCKLVEEQPNFRYAWMADADVVWERLVEARDVGGQEVFDLSVPGIENFVAEGIVIHNSFLSEMAMAYMLYRLSCYHNPQAEHDLAPGSSIIFIQQSRSFMLAKKVVFEQFAERVRRSPYFSKYFPFDVNIKSELRFPQSITVIPVGGNDTAALGMNVFGGIIDEMNFMARTENSVETKYTHEEEYDQAERLYTTLIRRMKSRFMQKGKLPGKLMLVSSVSYPGDFTSRKIEEAKTDNTILALNYSQWDVLPKSRFCGERFLVEVGSEFKQSRIIAGMEEAMDKEDVLHIPIEYKSDFERDLEAALRDLAGITTGTKHPFIPYREAMVVANQKYQDATGGLSLFKRQEVVLHQGYSDDWTRLVDMEYLENVIMDRSQPFAAHVDVALREDACGLAIGRIVGYKMLPSTKYYNERIRDFVEIRDIRAPIYMMDGVLRVLPPKGGGEIDLELVRDLILWLRGEIFIRWGTCDSYQSAMMLQAFRKARIRSGVLSVDTNIAPYTELKLAIKDERILLPNHTVLMKELREVEKDSEKDKVDHQPDGSKDVADSCAGVVYIMQKKEANYGRPVSGRKRMTEVDMEGRGGSVRHIRMNDKRARLRAV